MNDNSIPEGRYQGRATGEISFDTASTGTESVLIPLTFTSEGWEGRGVTLVGYLSERAAPITLRQMRDMGWQGDNLTDTTGLGDTEVSITVKYEAYDGKPRMKVAVWPLSGGGMLQAKNPIQGAALDALNKRLKGHILQSKQGKPAATTRPASNGWQPPPVDQPYAATGTDGKPPF